MVTVSLLTSEVLHIMEAFIAQEGIKDFAPHIKMQDFLVLLKLYKGLSGKNKQFGKDWLEAYFEDAEMTYKSFMPTFLKEKK